MKSLVNRRKSLKNISIIFTVVLVALALVLHVPVNAVSTYELVSVNNMDGQGLDRSGFVRGISADGNKILFSSSASNLPQASSTSTTQVSAGYIRDMNATSTASTRIDLSAGGIIPDRATTSHIMSTAGRYVAFSSNASNIIDGSTFDNTVERAYFKDLQTGSVELLTNISGVSVRASNGDIYPGSFKPVAVSDDGRFVIVSTNAVNNLVSGTRSGSGMYYDLVSYDRAKSTWTIIDKPINNVMQNQSTEAAYANCDGSLIAFTSAATNLTNNYSGGGRHVYLADVRNGLSLTDITSGATADSVASNISCNGRYITYSTQDRTLISPTPSGMDSYAHLVRYDRMTGERKYIDSASNNSTFSGYHDAYQNGVLFSSVSDYGDVALSYGPDTSPYNRKVYIKHLSDGSGTLTLVQAIYNPSSAPTFQLASNGKYIVASTRDGYNLGLLSTAPPSYDSAPYNIVRAKTDF